MLNCAHLENRRTGAAATSANLTRYATYYTPQPRTALAAFGRSWFGRGNDGVTLQAFYAAGLAGTSFAKAVRSCCVQSMRGLHSSGSLSVCRSVRGFSPRRRPTPGVRNMQALISTIISASFWRALATHMC
jgi:hypothetical protein